MATAAQVLANRENAQHSTGPRTDEGKANSSLNNLRHGLAARGFIVLPGQETDFAHLEEGLRVNLNPIGELQAVIFLRLLEAAWNLHRCRQASAQLYLSSPNPEIDPLIDGQLEAKYARIQKYSKQSEHSMRKSLEDLSRIQTELQYRHEAYPLTEEQLENEELFDQTPHALSSVCRLADVIDTVTRQEKRAKPSDAVRRKGAESEFRKLSSGWSLRASPRPTAPPRASTAGRAWASRFPASSWS